MSLSAASVNCTFGLSKLLSVSEPLALVEPSAIETFCSTAEFCEKVRLALPILSGEVSDGVLIWAFCSMPLPLKFMAAEFLIGPVACRLREMMPEPETPSAAETP